MKKISTVFILLMLLVLPLCVYAQKRNIAEARHIALHRMPDNATMLRSSEIVEHTGMNSEAFYVFTEGTQEHGSFVIVAGDERMGEVLAYSDQSSFTMQDIPANVRCWLEMCARKYHDIDEMESSRISLSISGSVEPIVQTRWGQLAPFNDLCPEVNGARTATGCVATAMAQALSVYKSPTCATGTVSYTTPTHGIHLSEDLADYPFPWNDILDNYADGYDESQAHAVANLMYACGLSLNMDYSSESGTPTSNLLGTAIERFGYDEDMVFANLDVMQVADWHLLLTQNLDKGMPVIYSGRNEYNEGHCFLLDGYTATDADPYYHVNWGWNGKYNGNYRIFSLSPSNTGTGGGSGNFNISNTAVLGFKPNDGIAENGGFLQAASISVLPQEVGPGEVSATVEIGSLYNYGARTFQGQLLIYLSNAEETNETLLDSYSLSSIPFMNGVGNISRRIVLPPSLEAGNYKIKVYAQADGMDKIPLYCGDEHFGITVLPDRQSYEPDLMVTELTLDTDGERKISVNATSLYNNDNIVFEGSLSLAIAKDNGEVLDVFGDAMTVDNLLPRESNSGILTIKGTVPSEFADGKYRLYLVAQQLEYTEWTAVTGYTMHNNEITSSHVPCYCVIKIEEGVVSVSEEDLPLFYADLQATGMTASGYNETNGNVTLTASNVRNFSDTDFVGTLSMVVCDREGNVITQFGDKKSIDDPLYSQNTLTLPVSLTGKLPVPTEDGKYSIRLLVQQKYHQGKTLMSKYVITITNITDSGLPCGADFWVIDGMVTFEPPVVLVESIELNKDRLILQVGGNYQLHATVSPDDATDNTIIWSSTNPQVVRVGQTGDIVAQEAGEAEIIATAADGSGVTASCLVTVMPVLAESIRLNYTRYALDPGKTVQLVATVLPRNTSNPSVEWSSTDENVATVDENGLVTLRSVGAADITATTVDGSNLSATCVVSSRNYLVEAIFVNPPEASLNVGESIRLSAIVLPADALNKTVEWSSSAPTVVSVNQYGLATALSDGKAVVYATAVDGSNVSGTCIFNCVSGIATITVTPQLRFYSPEGKPLDAPRKGLNIVKDSDGNTFKVIF